MAIYLNNNVGIKLATNAAPTTPSVDIATEATRIVDFQNVVLPDLGLPVQFRKWYDPSTGYLMYSMGVLYGVKFGIPSSGLKIVTA